jgi:hypothetical protein
VSIASPPNEGSFSEPRWPTRVSFGRVSATKSFNPYVSDYMSFVTNGPANSFQAPSQGAERDRDATTALCDFVAPPVHGIYPASSMTEGECRLHNWPTIVADASFRPLRVTPCRSHVSARSKTTLKLQQHDPDRRCSEKKKKLESDPLFVHRVSSVCRSRFAHPLPSAVLANLAMPLSENTVVLTTLRRPIRPGSRHARSESRLKDTKDTHRRSFQCRAHHPTTIAYRIS